MNDKNILIFSLIGTYFIIEAVTIILILRIKYFENQQKRNNILITIFFPLWIIVIIGVFAKRKRKERNDRGWVRQENEGSVPGTWIGGGGMP